MKRELRHWEVPTVPYFVQAGRRARRDRQATILPNGSKDMQIHARTPINCSALHLWIILRRVECFERWNPYVTIRCGSPDPGAIRYYFTNNPRSGLRAMLTGVATIDDPNMTLTLSFGTRKHFRFVETLSIVRTPSQHWLHHDLTGQGLGVKLMGRILTRRIEPLMLHADAMLEGFVTLSDVLAPKQGDVVRVGKGSKRQRAEKSNELN